MLLRVAGVGVLQVASEVRQAALVGVELDQQTSASDARDAERAASVLAERIKATLETHQGAILSEAPGSYILEFEEASAAVAAGEAIAGGHWPKVRVGVHVGGVMTKRSGEIFGQGLNVVQRVQQVSAPGEMVLTDGVKTALKGSPLAARLTPVTKLVIDETNASFELFRLAPPQTREEIQRQKARMPWIVAGAVVLLAMLAGALWAWREPLGLVSPPREKIAVLPIRALSGGPEAEGFVQDLTQELRRAFLEGGAAMLPDKHSAELRGPDRAKLAKRLGVAAVLQGQVAREGDILALDLWLEDPLAGKRVWSHQFRNDAEALQAQAPARVINVLNCASKALRPAAGLSNADELSLFLQYCDLDQDVASVPQALAQQEALLNKLVALAPNFSYSHSALAQFARAKMVLGGLSGDAAARLRDQAAAEASKALTLDRDNADAYAVQALLVPPPGWLQREKLLAAAAKAPVAGLDPPGQYALLLADTGRLAESIQFWNQATAANPFEPDYSAISARALAAAGRTDQAFDALDKSRRIAPDNATVLHVLFEVNIWAGRWGDAAQILDTDAFRVPELNQSLEGEDDRAAFHAFLAAAKSGDPAQISAAKAAEIAAVKANPQRLFTAISHLSALRLVDDAYALAAETPPTAAGIYLLFTPPMEPVRRDPRFMSLAARLGLAQYWSQSGKWPDFCRAADLPYQCAAEAAKYAAR